MNSRKQSHVNLGASVAAALIAVLSGAHLGHASSGIFQNFVIVNTGASNTYYDTEITAGGFDTGNANWGGFNLGTFDAAGSVGGTGTLTLNGAEVKTYKNGGSDVFGTSLFYRVYRQGSSAPAFTSVGLNFNSNLGGGDQKWDKTDLGFNTLIGRDAGVNNFEVYHTASTSDGTAFINNGGNNFIATFTVNAGTFLWDGGAGNGNTTSANNWSNNIAPGNRHNIQFAGSTQTSVTNSFTAVRGITFNSGASAFAVSGSALEVGAGGITNSSGSAQSISANLTNTAANTYDSGSTSGGSLAISGTVNNAGNLLTLAGSNAISISNQISGSGGLTKSGNGTTTLSGSNNYTGPTNVTGGTLTLATVGSINSSSSVLVDSGATLQVDGSLTSVTTVNGTLKGDGTLTGNTTVNGILSPGATIGKLTVASGSLTLADSTTTVMQAAGTTRGVSYDAVDVGGTMSYNGSLIVGIGGSYPLGANFDLFDFASQNGEFDSISVTGSYIGMLTNGGSGSWTGNFAGTYFTFTNSTGVLNLSAVPEPLTAAGVILLASRVLGRRSRVSM